MKSKPTKRTQVVAGLAVLLLASLAATQETPPTTPPSAGKKIPAEVLKIQTYVGEQVREGKIKKEETSWRLKLPRFPSVTFSEQEYFWHVKTNLGEMKLRFFPDVAPNHVANFMYLSSLGYFDGLTFHRVLKNFMAQGGCPVGSGSGGPGYEFSGEFKDGVEHDRPGLLSMANSGHGTDGSQFFLTFGPQPHLNPKHTIFGELVEGMGVLREIEKRGQEQGTGAPTETITIERAYVTPGRTPHEKAMAFLEGQEVNVSDGVETPSGLWFVDVVAGQGESTGPEAEVSDPVGLL